LGLREKINDKPGLAIGVLVAGVVVAIVVVVLTTRKATVVAPARAFYTTDEGATLFEDALDKAVPFDHDGAQAVLARVFSCDEGKTKFVGYLERMPEKVKKPPGERDTGRDIRVTGSVIRPPNSPKAKWVPKALPEGMAITAAVKCPDGSDRPVVEVFPK
jgi:hypothetical protein